MKPRLPEEIAFDIGWYQMSRILEMQKTVPQTPSQMILHFHCYYERRRASLHRADLLFLAKCA